MSTRALKGSRPWQTNAEDGGKKLFFDREGIHRSKGSLLQTALSLKANQTSCLLRVHQASHALHGGKFRGSTEA